MSAWGGSWGAAWGSAWGSDGPVVEMARRLLVTSLDGLVRARSVSLDAVHRPTVALDGLLVPREPQ
ncbi:MAG: hypothetical protein E5Y10_22910 [Mesorhizobium sp.]|uniref:hypothetical protein n=1 Tax=Mesorhizobium sp. TaxID=1871066 RepID=UPI00121D7283|nr:hypothetical protein [Mesorhizobium sp.]TIN41395.1 MAG: hypothetical protein E5Y13_05765 [Mesorhizobium sp.]TJU86173.1 MAG: hypothetical protein E5Y10_22910 [Mesorhizobium sp.]